MREEGGSNISLQLQAWSSTKLEHKCELLTSIFSDKEIAAVDICKKTKNYLALITNVFYVIRLLQYSLSSFHRGD